MKLNQIAIVISLLFSSHLVLGATYDLLEQIDSSDSGILLSPESSFLDLEEPGTEEMKKELVQEYSDTVGLIKKGQFSEAELKIKNLIEQYPEIPEFYNLRGLLEFIRKDNKIAINSFQKALELDSKNLKAQLGLANIFLDSGDFPRAKVYAKGALSVNGESIYAYILLAEIADKENNQQEVESILITALKKATGNSKQEILVAGKLGRLYVIQKQPQKTLLIANDIVKRYPEDSSALALLATAQVFNNKTTQAISTLETLINLERNNTRHRLLLVRLLAERPGNEQKILKILNETSSIAPDNFQIQVRIAFYFTQLKFFPEAFQAAKNVRQLQPDSGVAEILEGEIYLAENKIDQALEAFKNSYKIKSNEKVLSIITNIMLKQGMEEEVVNFLNQELKKDPKNFTAHLKLGNIYQARKKYREAEKHYQYILEAQPDNVTILNNLAWVYYLQDNPKALKLAESAYQKSPNSAAIADTYATILIKQGNLEKGISIFERASKLAPLNYDIQYHLANAYALNNQTKQSISILKTIVKVDKNYSEKSAAISLLNKLD